MRLYLIALGIVLLDQATKLLIEVTLPVGQSIRLIPHHFAIVHVLNPGAAFGLFAEQSSAFRNPFFIGISVLAAALILSYHRRHGQAAWRPTLGLGLILGGAIGNLIDRLRLGMVVDFLDVHYYQYHWPAFNVADSAISVGVGLMLLDMLLSSRPKEGTRPPSAVRRPPRED
jgi:signal peptidase II